MRIVKLLRKHHHQGKIFQPGKVAVGHCCLVRLEYFAELAGKVKKSHLQVIGFALAVVTNSRHDSEKRYALDKIDGMDQEVLWLSSNARAKFFLQRISITLVCEMYGNSFVTYSGVHYSTFSYI